MTDMTQKRKKKNTTEMVGSIFFSRHLHVRYHDGTAVPELAKKKKNLRGNYSNSCIVSSKNIEHPCGYI